MTYEQLNVFMILTLFTCSLKITFAALWLVFSLSLYFLLFSLFLLFLPIRKSIPSISTSFSTYFPLYCTHLKLYCVFYTYNNRNSLQCSFEWSIDLNYFLLLLLLLLVFLLLFFFILSLFSSYSILVCDRILFGVLVSFSFVPTLCSIQRYILYIDARSTKCELQCFEIFVFFLHIFDLDKLS